MSKHLLIWCVMLVLGVGAIATYVHGTPMLTLLLALLALVCPILIGWLYFRFGRSSDAVSGRSF